METDFNRRKAKKHIYLHIDPTNKRLEIGDRVQRMGSAIYAQLPIRPKSIDLCICVLHALSKCPHSGRLSKGGVQHRGTGLIRDRGHRCVCEFTLPYDM